MSSYSGSLSRKLKNQPGTDETEHEGKFYLYIVVLLFLFRGMLLDGCLMNGIGFEMAKSVSFLNKLILSHRLFDYAGDVGRCADIWNNIRFTNI